MAPWSGDAGEQKFTLDDAPECTPGPKITESSDRLTAEVLALRAIITRLLVVVARQFDGDPYETLRVAHGVAMEDFSKFDLSQFESGRADAIKGHAGRVLDEIFTTMKPRSDAR